MELSIATGTATAVEAQTVESVLPDHFETDAPELIKLLKAYYRHLNKELLPSYELNNLIRQHDVDRASEKYLDAIERTIASVIPKSRSLDRVRLFKIIANYYNSRGSEESIYAFFRIFYNELITLVYPKEHLFTVADLEKGTISTKNRIRDSFRWQEFSYVVNAQSDQANWRNEFIKFVHPAGLKFFVALTLELIQDNDWIKEALEYYLTVDGIVKLTSELPGAVGYTPAPENGTLYIVTDANDGDDPITKFDNVPRVFEYSTETSPEGWAEVESVLSFADWIDWDTFFGKHTPQDQYLNLSLAYLFKVLMGDGGYHYLTHTRLISDKKGTPGVDRDSLKAFFNSFILARLASNDNTIQSAYREGWAGETKFIDNAAWGEYGNATIAEAGAAYTNYSDGAFKYPSAFEVIDESEVPYLDFIESDLVVEDFNEPINSPITYIPAALSSSEYTEGWISFIIDTDDSSPQGLNHELIRIVTPTTEVYVRVYEPDLASVYGSGVEIKNTELFQIGDVFVNGVLAIDRDGNNYFDDGPLNVVGFEWTNLLPLEGSGIKHILMRYRWKLPDDVDSLTAESGFDPRFRALYDISAFSRVNLNVERFKKAIPDVVNRLNGVVKYSDTPSEYKVSYNTHFNNFSAGSSIDFYTRSFLDSLSIDEFDFIVDPNADFSPDDGSLATEHFVFTGTTEVNSNDSPQDDVIDVLHTFESDDSDLYFQFSEAQRTWALYTSDSSPEGEQLFINRTPWTIYPFIPEITEIDYTQWETVASYDDSTPLFGSSYPLAAIVSDDRFINILYKRGWDNNSPAYESPSQIFLSSTETIDEDDSPHYTHDTQTSFQNSFVFTQD